MATISPTSKYSEALFKKHVLSIAGKYGRGKPEEYLTVNYLKFRKAATKTYSPGTQMQLMWTDEFYQPELTKGTFRKIGFTDADIKQFSPKGTYGEFYDFYMSGVVNAISNIVKQTLARKPSLKNEQKARYWLTDGYNVYEKSFDDIVPARREAYRIEYNVRGGVAIVQSVFDPKVRDQKKKRIGVVKYTSHGMVWDDEKTNKRSYLNKDGSITKTARS